MALGSWPTVTDDDGSFTLGTVFNKALTDAIKASIEASVFSATNPSLSPANIIDEVVTARGAKATLDTRLDVSINEDGTLKAQAGQATKSDIQGIVAQGNWVANDNFQIWPGAAAEAPALWTLDTITCDRETTTVKVGAASLKLTRSGGDGDITHDLLSTAEFSVNGAYWKGKTFAFGAYIYTAVSSAVRVQIDDGVTTSETSYHTGTPGWEFLAKTHEVSASATKLVIGIQFLNSNGDAYVNGVTVIPSENALEITEWIPCRTQIGAVAFKYPGTVGTGTSVNNDELRLYLPFQVIGVDLNVGTAPTGQALIVDINTYNGATFDTMFATRPQVAAGAARSGFTEPDGSYYARNFDGQGISGNTITDALLKWDVDQVGSGVAGADLTVKISIMQFVPPQLPMKYVGV